MSTPGTLASSIGANTPEQRRLWKRFQQMAELPEKDQRAVIRLINSLSTVRASEARA